MNRSQTLIGPVLILLVLALVFPVACTGRSSSPPEEVEATQYMGTQLTPVEQQLTNALAGAQTIDKASYRLTVDGLVNNPLSLSYTDLLAYPQLSKLMDLNCVEGWHFTAKWTGPSLDGILRDAKVKSGAKIAIFHTADVPTGYSSLDLQYIRDNNIILALKDNDLTISGSKGFPFQVVAESKYGYKWAKWVTRIEISSDTNFRGYWEGWGYNNNADINGPGMETYSFGPQSMDITEGVADFVFPSIILAQNVEFSFAVTGEAVRFSVLDPIGDTILVGAGGKGIGSANGSFHALVSGDYRMRFISEGAGRSVVVVKYTVYFD